MTQGSGPDGDTLDAFASRGVAPSYISRIPRLTLLASHLVEAILDGRQPAELQLDDLLKGFRRRGKRNVPTSVDGKPPPALMARSLRTTHQQASDQRPTQVSPFTRR